jgi:methyl-accepting chemotaxis protein
MAARWLIAVASLVAALSLAAAGCGGGDDNGGESASAWADDLCGSLSTWTDSIDSTVNELRQNPSKDQLESATSDVKDATDTLLDDLKGLGAPDTDDGQEAKQTVDDLSTHVEDGVDTVQNAVDDASGASGMLNAISVASSTLATLLQDIKTAVQKLEGLNPGGELQSALQDSSSCQSLSS